MGGLIWLVTFQTLLHIIGPFHALSRDLVNHKKWSWYNIDVRNGKSVMK